MKAFQLILCPFTGHWGLPATARPPRFSINSRGLRKLPQLTGHALAFVV
jgi:hypothetical protein